MSNPAVAVLPYGKSLGRALATLPVDDLHWPLGLPNRLRDKTVGDLEPDDHLIVFPGTAMHFQPRWGTRARVSVLVCEPSVIHAKHLRLLRFTYRRFFRVLTFNESLLAAIPNGLFFPYGTTWVDNWRDLRVEKSAMTSLIASEKRDSEGHRLRHAIADWSRDRQMDVQIMGRGYTPFEHKADGLAPYRFSVVIENVREPNYFSEKLIDAILCDTVPIYWGCPNLDRFMNTRGIVECASEADLRQALQRATEKEYARRLPHLQAIKETAASYTGLEQRAVEALRDALSAMR